MAHLVRVLARLGLLHLCTCKLLCLIHAADDIGVAIDVHGLPCSHKLGVDDVKGRGQQAYEHSQHQAGRQRQWRMAL
eukprot:1137235-Pelagomonas_calceolata.AAC.10